MTTRESDRHVMAVVAALSLLECFERDEALRLKDFHVRTGIQKSRILRLLGTLEHAGFISSTENTFRLGPKVLALGQVVNDSFHDLAARFKPALQTITNTVGDTSFLSVVRGNQRMVLTHTTPEVGLCFKIPNGQLRPLHAGATGKVLLAFSRQEFIEHILSSELAGLTANTQIDPQKISLELAQVRERKYAVSSAEANPHAYAISKPILDCDGAILAAITVAGPATRLDQAMIDRTILLMDEEIEKAFSLSQTRHHSAQ